MKLLSIILLSSLFLFAGCGGGKEEADKAPETEETTEDVSTVKEIVIEGNDQMKFNMDKIQVKAGQKVKLTLKHVGQLPLAAMGHNWVLLNQGVDVADFAGDAIAAGVENQHIPQDRLDEIIVYTELIGGGEETSIEFDAPAVGEYTFISSFPGHWGMMQGKFIVK